MKKILLLSLLCLTNTFATAQNFTTGYSRGIVINNGFNNGWNNYSAIAQCQPMTEAQINMLSKMNMQNQVCVYETYAKLTEKWITNPPQQYVPPKSIVITLNQQETLSMQKEQLQQLNAQCQELAIMMRAKLKEKYNDDSLVCKQ